MLVKNYFYILNIASLFRGVKIDTFRECRSPSLAHCLLFEPRRIEYISDGYAEKFKCYFMFFGATFRNRALFEPTARECAELAHFENLFAIA
jgi:hypothetical protein